MATVTYNGVTCDLSGKFSQSHSTTSYIFDGIVQITSITSINSTVANLEDKLRRKNKDFSLSFNGTSVLSYKHGDNSGFLMKPTLSKIPNELSTGRSREYSFRVEIELPVDQDSYNYMREANYSLSYTPMEQRTLNFWCEYTAGGGNTAGENYFAHFTDFIDVILAKYPGTYVKVSEEVKEEQEFKIMTASVTYQEARYNYTVSYSPTKQKRLTFWFEYVAGSGNTAVENYYAAYNGFVTAIIDRHPGTYEKISEVLKEDQEYQTMTATVVYQEANYTHAVSYTPSRQKSITFNCEYVAGGGPGGGNTATQNYLANFTEYINTVIDRWGGTYEKISESINEDQEIKVTNATVKYQECIFDQSSGVLDNANIINPHFSFELSYNPRAGKALTTGIPVQSGAIATVTGELWLNRDTLDVNYTFNTIYNVIIRPYVDEYLNKALALSVISTSYEDLTYTISDSHTFDVHTYKVALRKSVFVPIGATPVIEYKESITFDSNSMDSYIPLWNGKDDCFSIYSPGRSITVGRTVVIGMLHTAPAIPNPITKDLISDLANVNKDAELRLVTHKVKRSLELLGGTEDFNILVYTDMYKLHRAISEKEGL